jgi:hypothetical protein
MILDEPGGNLPENMLFKETDFGASQNAGNRAFIPANECLPPF